MVNNVNNDHYNSNSMWHNLFCGSAISEEEANALRPVIAKYAPYIRRLTVRSLHAFRLFEPYCTNLTGFHCRFEPHQVNGRWVYWHASLTYSEIQQTHRDIYAFVSRQTNLDSLSYNSNLIDPIETQKLILESSHRWRHLDVYLDDHYYHNVREILPNARSARFAVASLATLQTPLEQPHPCMRELQLWASFKLDHWALNSILASFPNLQRLVVRCDIEAKPPVFDLTIDHGSMLYIGPGACPPPGGLTAFLAVIPQPLLVLDYAGRDWQDALVALSQYGQDVLYLHFAVVGPVATIGASNVLDSSFHTTVHQPPSSFMPHQVS
ncbi:hypothetical protein BGW42_003403 [Actinomortierella wolfii]|nr:hypothetical protein BGW42_003403 [Actinomortierella wolfii]